MDIDAYVDGIVELLVSAGVPREEIAQTDCRDRLAMCHMKGRDWTKVAMAACREFGVEVTD